MSDNTYQERKNDTPYLTILEFSETIFTTDGKFSYLLGKKKGSNDVSVKKNNMENNKVESIVLEYVWMEIQQSINIGSSLKDAYMNYLSYQYRLGRTKHKNYKGYQTLIEFIEPLMVDVDVDVDVDENELDELCSPITW